MTSRLQKTEVTSDAGDPNAGMGDDCTNAKALSQKIFNMNKGGARPQLTKEGDNQ